VIHSAFVRADFRLPFSCRARAQFKHTPLIPRDRASIGNRHTARGFDGEMPRMAERASCWRDELAGYFAPGHPSHLLRDSGHVYGPPARWLAGVCLEGRGLGGTFHYDLLSARPVKTPAASAHCRARRPL
jgi:hemolysin activation/secretion protein